MILGPLAHARAMYRSLYHHRPPAERLFELLPGRVPTTDGVGEPAAEIPTVDLLARGTGLAGIWVRTNGMRSAERARWLAVGPDRADLRLVARIGGDLLFAVATSR
jgi:hypothetical protein